MDRCVHPALGAYAPSMLQMIGIGFVILIIATVMLAVITAVDLFLNLVAIVICLFVYGVGLMLVIVSGKHTPKCL